MNGGGHGIMGDNGRKNQTNGDYIRVQDPHLNSFLTPSFWFLEAPLFFCIEKEREGEREILEVFVMI